MKLAEQILFNFLPLYTILEKSVNSFCSKKVQVGNDQVKAQSERNSRSKNRDGKNYIDN